MPVTSSNYHCDKCANGIHVVKTTRRAAKNSSITMAVKDCNSCGEPSGFNTIARLKPVVNPDFKINTESEC